MEGRGQGERIAAEEREPSITLKSFASRPSTQLSLAVFTVTGTVTKLMGLDEVSQCIGTVLRGLRNAARRDRLDLLRAGGGGCGLAVSPCGARPAWRSRFLVRRGLHWTRKNCPGCHAAGSRHVGSGHRRIVPRDGASGSFLLLSQGKGCDECEYGRKLLHS